MYDKDVVILMRNQNDKNIIDKFLEGYAVANENSKQDPYQRVYQKPSKFKCIVGFIFSALIMFFLIRIFKLNFMFLLIFFIDLVVLIFYGVNLFTKKGIAIPKYVKKDEYTDNDDINNKYKVR